MSKLAIVLGGAGPSRGDPIFGLAIGSLVGAIGRKIFGSGIKKAATRLLPAIAALPLVAPLIRRGGTGLIRKVGGVVATGALFEAGTRLLPGQVAGQQPRRRRMNVTNVKALRRSMRRVSGFHKLSKKVEADLRKFAPPARRSSSGRRHSGGPPRVVQISND